MRMEPSNVKKKKVKKPPNVRKELSHVMLELPKCEDETVKCEKKVRKPLNVRKELSHVMLRLQNVKMEPSSLRKK